MLSRVLMAKPSPIKAAPKPKAGPKPATEYFAEEEAAKFPSPAYSLGGLNIFASGDDGEPRSPGGRGLKPLQWPMQAKLEVGAVDDPLEYQADHTAEWVMRMTEPPLSARTALAPALSKVQRQCACGGTCAECQMEKEDPKKLQRKTTNAAGLHPSSAPAIVHEVLRSRGQPLEAATRNFFEPRFAQDFGRVRIHAGARAAESARAVHALAFTVGNNIVFGDGQYAPGTDSGKRLIAHELSHIVQQGSGCQPLLQRAVTKDYARLRKLLSRSFWHFDWAITDQDAHDVLVILKALSPADLKDTVAAMEKDDLVDKLFSNVSDDDSKKETDILQDINDVRVHKGEKGQPDITGPCDAKHQKEINDRVQSTKDWAREAKKRANDFAADPAKHADTGKLLDTHFFHQKFNKPLPAADQITNARTIAANFETVELQAAPMPNLCASPFDPLCSSLALAYVDSKKNRVVFCDSYFGDKPQRQVYHLIHEFTHEFAGVDDRGYGSERIFAYLSPADAMNNADSYALFAVDVTGGKEKSQDIRSAPSDSVSDCSRPQGDEIRRRFAFAARMITNALNVIGDPHIGGAEALAHFKTQDRAKLQDVIDRFKKITDKFGEGLNFECEDDCGANETSYRRGWGWTVHICPGWFKLTPDDARSDDILHTAVSEELGLDYGPSVGSAAYVNQSAKQAYKGASSYVGYARAVTRKFFP